VLSSGRYRRYHRDIERAGGPSRVSGTAHRQPHMRSRIHTHTQADPHLLLRSRCHTSVGNASPPSGPFSQALARALVPHLSDTSGITRHSRRRCCESLGTPRGRLPPRKIASAVRFCYSPSGYRVAERYLLISSECLEQTLGVVRTDAAPLRAEIRK